MFRDAATAAYNPSHTAVFEAAKDYGTPNHISGYFETLIILTYSTALEREEPIIGPVSPGANVYDDNYNGTDKALEKKVHIDITEKIVFACPGDRTSIEALHQGKL